MTASPVLLSILSKNKGNLDRRDRIYRRGRYSSLCVLCSSRPHRCAKRCGRMWLNHRRGLTVTTAVPKRRSTLNLIRILAQDEWNRSPIAAEPNFYHRGTMDTEETRKPRWVSELFSVFIVPLWFQMTSPPRKYV